MHPFIVLVAVLFGSTLLGVLGALVAIPVAASVQIAIREWWDYRHDRDARGADRAGRRRAAAAVGAGCREVSASVVRARSAGP